MITIHFYCLANRKKKALKYHDTQFEAMIQSLLLLLRLITTMDYNVNNSNNGTVFVASQTSVDRLADDYERKPRA